MASVNEVSAPYANFLRRTLPAGNGVCDVCQTSVIEPWTRCYQCKQAGTRLPARADAVGFVALAVKYEQFAHELWHYKYSTRPTVRDRLQLGLAAVLWRWLARHEGCLAAAATIECFEAVTVIPSTSVPAADRPLRQMVATQIAPTRNRFIDLIRTNPAVSQGRSLDHERWIASPLDGESVLIIDDTWTTGGHAQSAAAALKRAGANKVAVLALGRHFQRTPDDERYKRAAESYYRRSRSAGWDWNVCSVGQHTSAP